MQRRHNCVWAFGILAILATVLALQHRSGDLNVGNATCASTPSIPRACFESANEARLRQSHFGGFDGTCASAYVPSRSLPAYAGQQADPLAIARNPLYGSLFRRPPPNLS